MRVQKSVNFMRIFIVYNNAYAHIGKCFICAESAWNECGKCLSNFTSDNPTPPEVVYFCENCAKLSHKEGTGRQSHKFTEVADDPGRITELDLLSVICIETSHYICFTRSEDRWVFFDSMANRVSKSHLAALHNNCALVSTCTCVHVCLCCLSALQSKNTKS